MSGLSDIVHMEIYQDSVYWYRTACGIVVQTVYTSPVKQEVTCKACLRVKASTIKTKVEEHARFVLTSEIMES